MLTDGMDNAIEETVGERSLDIGEPSSKLWRAPQRMKSI
jgi:hypothetical protein